MVYSEELAQHQPLPLTVETVRSTVYPCFLTLTRGKSDTLKSPNLLALSFVPNFIDVCSRSTQSPTLDDKKDSL